jgi:branched-chain amino acid transport system ATP-binding protein
MSQRHTGRFFLETRELRKSFGGVVAVNGVNFKLPHGELRSIIGPNGAGKSTFFNILAGNIKPTEGQVFYKGENITNLKPYQISHLGIGRSFQVTNIFPELTAFENVRVAAQSRKTTYGMWRDGASHRDLNEKTEVILRKVKLSERQDLLASTLGYGEQRYLEIGIALATDPELLLLDEPTAGMSPEETGETALFIKELSKSLTIILVEHDMEVVMGISDYVTVLDNGSILAEGTPEDIRRDEEVQRVYLRE